MSLCITKQHYNYGTFFSLSVSFFKTLGHILELSFCRRESWSPCAIVTSFIFTYGLHYSPFNGSKVLLGVSFQKKKKKVLLGVVCLFFSESNLLLAFIIFVFFFNFFMIYC